MSSPSTTKSHKSTIYIKSFVILKIDRMYRYRMLLFVSLFCTTSLSIDILDYAGDIEISIFLPPKFIYWEIRLQNRLYAHTHKV